MKLLDRMKDKLAAVGKPLDDDPQIATAMCEAIEEFVEERIMAPRTFQMKIGSTGDDGNKV